MNISPGRRLPLNARAILGLSVALGLAIAGWITEFGSLDRASLLGKTSSARQEGTRIAVNGTRKRSNETQVFEPMTALPSPMPFTAFPKVPDAQLKKWAKHNCHMVSNICHDKVKQRLIRYIMQNTTSEAWSLHKAPTVDGQRESPEKPYKLLGVHPSNDSCVSIHPVKTHVVLYGAFSWFLMEFYVRILSHWWTILDQPDFKATKAAFANDKTSIRFYSSNPRVTSTQHILMEAFSDHSFSSLHKAFWNRPPAFSNGGNQQQQHKNETSPCPRYECFSEFLFCGYRREDYELKHGRMVALKPSDMSSKHVLQRPFQDLKTYIRHQVLDPRQEQMNRLKRDLIAQATSTSSTTLSDNDLNDWKVIGFSQRTGRRRWINLSRILEHCRDGFLSKHHILCIEVNMDDPDMQIPEQQAVVHGILDGLIGIHGSQQTHALWMKPHSTILEMLPYLIPGERWGGWTQATNQCTPNGYMTKNTDLHHIGHPMALESVPNCTGYGNATSCNDCVEWDNRDFLVNWTVLESFLQHFFVEPRPTTCDDFEQLARTDEFVLYTVHCSTMNGTKWKTKEFFRPRSSFPNLQRNSGLQYGEWFAKCILAGPMKGDRLTDRISNCGHTYDELVPNRSSLFV